MNSDFGRRPDSRDPEVRWFVLVLDVSELWWYRPRGAAWPGLAALVERQRAWALVKRFDLSPSDHFEGVDDVLDLGAKRGGGGGRTVRFRRAHLEGHEGIRWCGRGRVRQVGCGEGGGGGQGTDREQPLQEGQAGGIAAPRGVVEWRSGFRAFPGKPGVHTVPT